MIYIQALGVWILLLITALVNATFRTKFLQPRLKNELRSHQISSIMAVILFLFIIYIFFRFTGANYTENDLINIGFMWMMLTIVFEFLFGYLVMNHSFKRLLQDYNLTKGRLWIWVLLTLLLGPLMVNNLLL